MKIKIIGSGCAGCNAMYEKTKKIISENKIDAQVEHVKDINALIELGVMSSPALVIDNEVVLSGKISDSELKELLLAKTGKK